MIIPIIYPSAGEFWTNSNPDALLGYSYNNRKLTSLPADYDFCVNSKIARKAAEILGVSKPLYLSAPHQNYKRKGKSCVIQAHPNGFPPDSFVNYRCQDLDMYLACPELCFLLAARSRNLDFIDLIKFGYDLCAIYYPVPNSKLGQMPRTPFTFVNYIREYLAQAPYGTTNALKALSFVRDFSNSPIETRLAMFSALSSGYGGCGFADLELNKAITLTPKGRDLVGVSEIRGDLVFGRTVAEYNSNAVHLDASSYTDDMNRQTALKLAGYNYVAITYGHIKSFYSLMNVMNSIAVLLNKPPLKETPERKALYIRLFDRQTGPSGW